MLKHDGTYCPACGSQALCFSAIVMDDGLLYQNVTCTCGATWNEIFESVGLDELAGVWEGIPDYPLGEAPDDLPEGVYRLVVIKRALKAGYEDDALEEVISSALADLMRLCAVTSISFEAMLDIARKLEES